MDKKRKDNKGRILHNGEVQLADGKYRYKYVDETGKERFLYSWRLLRHDPVLQGKKKTLSLRELERQVEADAFDHIVTNGGNITVLELVEKYIMTKTGVRTTTKAGYRTVINHLKYDTFGRKRIDTVRISDAKVWLIGLQKNEGKSFSTLHSMRGVLRPAFQMAVDDDLLRKNPFSFQLIEVLVNDSVRREAISREEERKILDFVKNDIHFKRYYEGIYILFKTGLRISEFCGLTVSDIDLKGHRLFVDHQLHKRGGYYIEKTKTESGNRIIPMTREVAKCFVEILKNRQPPNPEPMVDGKVGFLYFDKNGSICYNLHWEHYFKHIVEKYNSIYKVQLPKITPHVCRHPYCSNMAKSGMNPKTLQYLMGHSDISVTLNIYTHVNFDDAKEEINKLSANN